MNKKRLTSFLIMFLVLGTVLFDPKVGSLYFGGEFDNNKNNINLPLIHSNPEDLNITSIFISNEIGSNNIKWDIDGYINGTNLNPGTYTIYQNGQDKGPDRK